MDDADRQFLRESNAFLERLQESTRETARKKLKAGANLSTYEKGLLGDEAVIRKAPAPPPPDDTPTHREIVAAQLCPKGIVFRTPFLAQLNAHVIDLVDKHGINVTRIHEVRGAAHSGDRRIDVPACTNETTYAIVLHEIGHLVSPDGDSHQYPYEIKDGCCIAPGGEAGAWRWAIDNALQWTVEMHRKLYQSLYSYSLSATGDERFELSRVLSRSALSISDAPIAWGELNDQCDRIRNQ